MQRNPLLYWLFYVPDVWGKESLKSDRYIKIELGHMALEIIKLNSAINHHTKHTSLLVTKNYQQKLAKICKVIIKFQRENDLKGIKLSTSASTAENLCK